MTMPSISSSDVDVSMDGVFKPVRLKLSSGLTWEEFLILTDKKLTALKAYEKTPLFKIARYLDVEKRDNPLGSLIWDMRS